MKDINEEKMTYENLTDNDFNRAKELNDTTNNKYDAKYISRVIAGVIKNKDAVVLGPMNYKQRKKIYDILEDMSDIRCFTIGSGEERKLVLKYTILCAEKTNITKILIDYRNDFNKGNYENGIERIKQIIYTVDKPKSFVFYDIGMCYFKMRDNENAIKYLTLFQEINKETKEDRRDVSRFISYLKWIVTKEDYKPFAQINLNEFESNIDNKYSVNNIEEIKNTVLYSGVSIEDACRRFGVGEENNSLIKLIIAKELYLHGKDYIAERIIKVVEKEKNKSAPVKTLLYEIVANKRLYMNKRNEEAEKKTSRLSLTKLV
jgi:tetratricopeptide (TPR) repeat protein